MTAPDVLTIFDDTEFVAWLTQQDLPGDANAYAEDNPDLHDAYLLYRVFVALVAEGCREECVAAYRLDARCAAWYAADCPPVTS